MIESIILTNNVTGDKLPLSMTETPVYVLSNVSWGSVSGTHNAYSFVNQVGEYVTNTVLGTRDVSIQGYVIAENEALMNERKAFLNSFVNPQQEIKLQYKDYDLDFLPDASIKWSTEYADNNDRFALFEIDGYAPDPLFESVTDNKLEMANAIGGFYFPLVISETPDPPGGLIFGTISNELIANVYNGGAVPVGIEIVFKAKGTLTNPSITHIGKQEFFKINKGMVAGEEIRVNTVVGEKGVVGIIDGVEKNYFKYRDIDSSWIQLDVGDNYIRYNADEGIENLQVQIYHKNKVLEVEQCY